MYYTFKSPSSVSNVEGKAKEQKGRKDFFWKKGVRKRTYFVVSGISAKETFSIKLAASSVIDVFAGIFANAF